MKRQYLIILVLTIFLLLFLNTCGGKEPVIPSTGSTHEDPQRESSAGKASSEVDPALKQETAKSLLEKILSSDFLWQSAEQSGSVFFGPYEQWREKLPELCELETREDAPELLLQEYAYLMEDFYEKPRDLSTPAQRYRSTAVITILYQPCFLYKLPKEQRESFIIIAEGSAKTAEEMTEQKDLPNKM